MFSGFPFWVVPQRDQRTTTHFGRTPQDTHTHIHTIHTCLVLVSGICVLVSRCHFGQIDGYKGHLSAFVLQRYNTSSTGHRQVSCTDFRSWYRLFATQTSAEAHGQRDGAQVRVQLFLVKWKWSPGIPTSTVGNTRVHPSCAFGHVQLGPVGAKVALAGTRKIISSASPSRTVSS